MNVENELEHKAYNIDLFAKKAAEDVAALGQYSGLLLDLANQIQMEMELLREQNKKFKEALEFYADRGIYRLYGDEQGRTCKAERDNGHRAREVLQECEL